MALCFISSYINLVWPTSQAAKVPKVADITLRTYGIETLMVGLK